MTVKKSERELIVPSRELVRLSRRAFLTGAAASLALAKPALACGITNSTGIWIGRPCPPSGGGGTSISYCDRAASTGQTNTSVTFSGRSIGTAATGRLIVAGVVARTNAGTPNITIGGNAMTTVVENANDPGFAKRAYISQYQLDTGTTANFVVTWEGGGFGAAAIYIFALYGVNATASSTAINDDYATGSLQTTANLVVPTSGVGVIIGVQETSSDTVSWGDGITQDAGSPAYLSDTLNTAIGGYVSAANTYKPKMQWGAGVDHRAAMASAAWGP